jgi:pentatricopeptide repeat protein
MADLFMNSSFKVVASLMSLHTYAKCGSIDDAWRVFNKMPSQHVVTWNAIILGHVKLQVGAEGTGTISINAAGGCATRLCSFCGGAECMCQAWLPLKRSGVFMNR